ncbi:MAG: TlpA disulfide reductase family protein [bacterium]
MTKNILAILFIGLLFFTGCSPKEKTQGPTNNKDFTLTSLDGKDITLSELKGQVVLVDFWATWCPPCERSIPVFSALYNKYHEKGFMVLGISREDKSRLISYRQENNIPYPILIDNKNVTKEYGVEAIPTIIFFDKTGKSRKTQVGFAPELEAAFDMLVDSLLNEQ